MGHTVKQRDTRWRAVLYTDTKAFYEVRAIKIHCGVNIAKRYKCINELKQVQECSIDSNWQTQYRGTVVWKITDLKPNCQTVNLARRQRVMCVWVESEQLRFKLGRCIYVHTYSAQHYCNYLFACQSIHFRIDLTFFCIEISSPFRSTH